MGDAPILRLLELVCRELGASHARVEIGGPPPDDARMLHCPLGSTRRLVAAFEAPPPATHRERLAAIAASFGDLAAESASPDSGHVDPRALASRRLDDELHALALRAGAASALVIDDRSPVIWGTSEPRRIAQEDVETAMRTASVVMMAEAAGLDLAELIERDSRDVVTLLDDHGLDRQATGVLLDEVMRLQEASRRRGLGGWRSHLLTARAIATVRDTAHSRPRTGHLHEVVREDGFGFLARSFATIYTLLVVFEGNFSELHAEGAVLQALPVIERLVLALPPTDPPRGGAKVVRLVR